MENFSFCSPTYFEFGKGAELKAGELANKFGGTKLLLHYGGGSIKKNGLYDRVVSALNGAGLPFAELGGVQPNPVDTLVYEGIELCRKDDVDFILAVGGGSTIDSAKAIAAGAVYDGDFWDFFAGKYIEKALPVGTVLTIAAAGSEGSCNSVITKTKANLKRGATGEAIRPAFSILNPELTQSLPPYQTAAGAVDIMIHICERYFSNTKEVEVTDRLCEALLLTMISQTPRVVADPNDYEARANIMWAGMVAHNNLCGVGREQDWASHGMEHELSAFYGATHGAGLAVIAPAWMKFVSRKNPDKFTQFAERVWGVKEADEGIKCFEAFLKSIGMPRSIKEFGANEEDIPMLAEHIGLTEERSFGNYVKLNVRDVEEIYRLALA
ncbi:MAG: iron-containing alcohol dehydrogenase [Oscillospiraceae bacterium]|jgi:alcohol dehydrogenase YqhD (iron-dependent ADH family)|nr:iron-containing alcohol dehydrogenase [Oscillospiraceae bacterium]